MSKAALSIIIPVYNGEKYIKQAITSVLLQPCKDFEIIIIDDGSKDNTYSIIKEMENNHEEIVVIHTDNGGVSKARNHGLSVATGKYISFLDADDVWGKNVYDESLCSTLKDEKYDVIKMGYGFADSDLCRGNIINFQNRTFCDQGNLYADQFRDPIPSYFYKREMLCKKKINFPEGVAYGEDMIFLFECSMVSHNLLMENRILFFYRSNRNSTVHRLNLWNAKISEIDGWITLRNTYTDPNIIDKCNSAINWYTLRLIKYGCQTGIHWRKILSYIDNNEYIKKIIHTTNSENSNDKDFLFCKLFLKHPVKVWIKERIYGSIIGMLKIIKNTCLGNFLNKKLRYKVNLEGMIYK